MGGARAKRVIEALARGDVVTMRSAVTLDLHACVRARALARQVPNESMCELRAREAVLGTTSVPGTQTDCARARNLLLIPFVPVVLSVGVCA